ncbi:MAG: invasion associated locus B family protein [Pseudomonadota bacterium]
MTRFALSLFTGAAALLTTAATAAPETVATDRDWIVYQTEVEGDTVCYAVTQPTDKDPNSVNHGDVFFMVANWKSGAAKGQPSFMAGYTLRDGLDPIIRIGSDKWDMFASGVEGFIEEDAEESRLITAMRRGSEMRLSAMSERGTATEYTFSLYGVSNALDRAARTCR